MQQAIYVLDSSAITSKPEVLNRAGATSLVVPEAVLSEMQGRRNGLWSGRLGSLLSQAIKAGLGVIPNPMPVAGDFAPQDRDARMLSGADLDIARVALAFASEGKRVGVVTLDSVLRRYLEARSVSTFSPEEFLEKTSVAEKGNEELKAAVEQLSNDQVSYLVRNVSAAVLAMLVFAVFWFFREPLLNTLNIWSTVIGLLVLGVAFYSFRQRQRLAYGLCEVAFGWFGAAIAFWPTFNYQSVGVTGAIQIFGGLYVIVRGLDNIGKCVVDTRFESKWIWALKSIK